jgi:hypothetical protein
MDWAHPQGITQRHVAADDIVCGSPCLGFVITVNADEWSQFALGQLRGPGGRNVHPDGFCCGTEPCFPSRVSTNGGSNAHIRHNGKLD